MRVFCYHGFFKFQELRPAQISDFMSLTGIELVSLDDFYTFKSLGLAPSFSLKGLDLLGIPATATFEGIPGKVFEANEVIYDFTKDKVVPIVSVTRSVEIARGSDRFLSNGLILPGSVTDDGKRVRDYAGFFSRESLTWTYTEVRYV